MTGVCGAKYTVAPSGQRERQEDREVGGGNKEQPPWTRGYFGQSAGLECVSIPAGYYALVTCYVRQIALGLRESLGIRSTLAVVEGCELELEVWQAEKQSTL